MKVVKKKLSDLRRPERNVRRHTEKQIKEFRRSVEMFGQIRPIVIDEENVILAGNGLFETLLSMEWAEADCYVVQGLSEAEKKKLMLADNKIYGLGVDDLDALDTILAELKDDLDIPGFDEELLSNMMADASDVTDKLQEYGTLDETEIEEIKEARERKERYMATGIDGGGESTEHDTAQPEQGEPVGRYVVCPHCGEKVWL